MSTELDRTADADRYETVSGGFDTALFAAARIALGEHVLDIGCGYGRTTRRAALSAGAGRAVGNDVAAPLIEVARKLAAAEGIGNATFEVGDAQTYAFPAGAFDVAISRFGVMFFADPVAAFGNIARALRPGGRLAFVTVGPPERNDLPALIASVAPGPGGAGGVHALSDPARIEHVLGQAGFGAVEVTETEAAIDLGPTPADAAEFILSWGAFRGLVDEDDPGAVVAARTALASAARRFHDPEGVRLRNTAWLATGVRPGR